jgi:transposase
MCYNKGKIIHYQQPFITKGSTFNMETETVVPSTNVRTDNEEKLIYNEIPKQVSRKDFNKYIDPHLSKPKKGPKPKISFYKIFNYILYVLHTGVQWRQLKTRRNEIHWSNVYIRHNRWSKDGSYQKLFSASVIHLKDTDQLDISLIHGDGSNTVVKKGVQASVTVDTSTRKETKNSP